MKYATQNMPNIVSLENGNEEAVKHKRKCSTISVPNSPRSLILETGVFEKYTPKSYVFGDRLRRTCVAVKAIPRKERLHGVSRNKDASGRSLKFVQTILFAVFVLKSCNALGIFFKPIGQRIFCVMDSWTERIILEGI